MNAVISYVVPIALLFGMMYFFMVLPEKKRKKEYDSMISGLKLNDEIMTRGGVIGKIVSLEDDSMVLESGPSKTRIRFSKNSVSHTINKKEEVKEKKAKEKVD